MGGFRVSRFLRPPSPPSFRLTERDLDILESIGRARFLTAQMVEWLHFPPQKGRRAKGFSSNCRKRLRLLWQVGYIERLWIDHFNTPAIYGLSGKGAKTLALYRGINTDELAVVGRRKPSPLFLEHGLAIAQTYAAIAAVLSGNPSISLAEFRAEHTFKGKGCYDLLPDPIRGPRLIPVIPDGLFILERSDGRRKLIFLEVDQATMSLKRVSSKIRGYEAYRFGKGPSLFKVRFGYPPDFFVAVVVSSPSRLEKVKDMVRKELKQLGWQERLERYLFKPIAELNPEKSLVWEDASGHTVSLVEGAYPEPLAGLRRF